MAKLWHIDNNVWKWHNTSPANNSKPCFLYPIPLPIYGSLELLSPVLLHTCWSLLNPPFHLGWAPSEAILQNLWNHLALFELLIHLGLSMLVHLVLRLELYIHLGCLWLLHTFILWSCCRVDFFARAHAFNSSLQMVVLAALYKMTEG